MAYHLPLSTKGAINLLKMFSTNLQSKAPSSVLLLHRVQTSTLGILSLTVVICRGQSIIINFYIPRIKHTLNNWRSAGAREKFRLPFTERGSRK